MTREAALKKGGPGRPRGSRNRVTLEVREIATRLVTDPAYVEALSIRLREGTAGPMEPLLWTYAYGKPKETGEGPTRCNVAFMLPDNGRDEGLTLSAGRYTLADETQGI